MRVDDGVDEGAEISVYYDPMVAKLVTHGADRAAAIAAMRAALNAYYVRGVSTNIGFLASIAAHPRFQAGDISTDFIAEVYPGGYVPPPPTAEMRYVLAAAAAVIQAVDADRAHAGDTADGTWHVSLDGNDMEIGLRRHGDAFALTLDGHDLKLTTAWRPGQPFFDCTVDGAAYTIQVDRIGPHYRLGHDGVIVSAKVLRPRTAELLARMPHKPPPDRSRFLLSPMPGLLTAVVVRPGQIVKEGEELAIVEAMKMENHPQRPPRRHRQGDPRRTGRQPGR